MKTLGYVVSVGARTSMGLDARQTGLFLRTGMPSVRTAPLVDPEGGEVTMGFDPTLDPYLVGEARAAELARAALSEVARPLFGFGRQLRVKVVLCLDEPRQLPGGFTMSADATGLLGSLLAPTVRQHFGEPTIEVCARGAAGGARPLASALAELERNTYDAILFGGVHTDYDPVTISWLQQTGRLYSASNIDAVLPGECAAFALIAQRTFGARVPRSPSREPDALEPRRAALEPMARVHAIDIGWEEAGPFNDKSAFGASGLTDVVRGAARGLPSEMKVGWGIADHAFELFRIYEWQSMITRTQAVWGPPMTHDAPAQRMGHLGGAALPLELVVASEALSRGYAPSPLGICFAGSDSGERGAILFGGV